MNIVKFFSLTVLVLVILVGLFSWRFAEPLKVFVVLGIVCMGMSFTMNLIRNKFEDGYSVEFKFTDESSLFYAKMAVTMSLLIALVEVSYKIVFNDGEGYWLILFASLAAFVAAKVVDYADEIKLAEKYSRYTEIQRKSPRLRLCTIIYMIPATLMFFLV